MSSKGWKPKSAKLEKDFCLDCTPMNVESDSGKALISLKAEVDVKMPDKLLSRSLIAQLTVKGKPISLQQELHNLIAALKLVKILIIRVGMMNIRHRMLP